MRDPDDLLWVDDAAELVADADPVAELLVAAALVEVDETGSATWIENSSLTTRVVFPTRAMMLGKSSSQSSKSFQFDGTEMGPTRSTELASRREE